MSEKILLFMYYVLLRDVKNLGTKDLNIHENTLRPSNWNKVVSDLVLLESKRFQKSVEKASWNLEALISKPLSHPLDFCVSSTLLTWLIPQFLNT